MYYSIQLKIDLKNINIKCYISELEIDNFLNKVNSFVKLKCKFVKAKTKFVKCNNY